MGNIHTIYQYKDCLMRNFSKYEVLSDKDVWDAFKQGSEEAFEFIFEKHIRVLYNYGDKITSKFDLVEDCIQELFIEIWEKKSQLGETNSIKFYLFVSLRRKIQRRLSKSNHIPIDNTFSYSTDFLASTLSYEAQLIENQTDEEQKAKLESALQHLSDKQKTAVFLKFYDKLNYEEIAALMSLPVKSVYDLIYQAIKSLKKIIHKGIFYFFIGILVTLFML